MKSKIEEILKLIDWATGDDTGSSSEALCRFMLGLEPGGWGFQAPSDADDRGRCIRLLNLVPEWWDRLDEMAEIPGSKVLTFEHGEVERGWKEQIPLIKKEAELERNTNGK